MSIAVALLQGALGGALLIILVFVLVAAVAILAGAVGGMLGRNPGSPEAGETDQTESILPPGTMLAAVGLGFAALGAIYSSMGISFLGMAMGAIAYYRGGRGLGAVTSVLSLVAIFVGYYLGNDPYQFDFG